MVGCQAFDWITPSWRTGDRVKVINGVIQSNA